MWAALAEQSKGKTSGAPYNTIWTKQIEHTLAWLVAFLDESAAKLTRTYLLSTYLGNGMQVAICLDASPWGLGGFLVENATIVTWFACNLSQEEMTLLRITEAESSAQQVVESLAVLVALRAWMSRWLHNRIQLRVKSDNISALVMSLKLKTSGHGTSIVAREMALDIAQSEYRPDVAEHIPGVDNVLADLLSRKYMPNSGFVVPLRLQHVPETVLPSRSRSYFRTLGPPVRTSGQSG